MRRAKIVCTIGPASSDEATIEALIRAGMNVARLNFSHGSHEDHRGVYETVRRVAQRLDTPVAILQDLQGPKMRVGTFVGGEATLVEGQRFRLVTDEVEGDSEQVSLGHRDLVHDVRAGEEILLDDGLLRLKVEHVDETGIETTVMVGGVLKNRKGMNLPMTTISMPSWVRTVSPTVNATRESGAVCRA
jgi:pyruvate kinase